MSGRTVAGVNPTAIRDVTLIRAVQINAIPAALEGDLRAQSISTRRIGHIVGLRLDDRVYAEPSDSVGYRFLPVPCKSLVVVASKRRTSRDHAKPWWKGHKTGVIASSKIVHKSSGVMNINDGTVWVLIVQKRRPLELER